MIARLRATLDSTTTLAAMTKLYLRKCDTPLPTSRGVAFRDKYMDENWQEAPLSPDND